MLGIENSSPHVDAQGLLGVGGEVLAHSHMGPAAIRGVVTWEAESGEVAPHWAP